MTGTFAAGAKAFVLAWLCTFAIAFQCIIVPAHIHAKSADLQVASVVATDTAGNVTQTADLPGKQRPVDETQSHCFICQQMALAGAAILPDSPTPILIQRDLSQAAPVAEIVSVSLSPSHIWRSRAPPSFLQV